VSRATRFLDACARRPTDCTPVWLMRQAGRYQASYRAVRQGRSFLELCETPELAAQVTVSAVEELGVDAAIIFSDILIAAQAMGAPVEITDQGPVLASPLRDAAAVDALHVPDPTTAAPTLLEAVRVARRALDGRVPLIGFAGAPLTLASYLVEGGNSKSYAQLKALLFGQPEIAHRLLDKLARTVSALLRAQIAAGCQAVQLFDSWAGILGPADYRAFALPYLKRIVDDLAGLGVPRILFATSCATLLDVMRESGADVISVDWRIEIDEARRRLGDGVALQGNLDPGCLFLPPLALEARVAELLGRVPRTGHVFNLGHGVLPGTPEESVRRLVQAVHRLSAVGP
jgi:uroporphyrinogen decarboxylase